MTLSPRKKEQLSALLAELPQAAAYRLFEALEADRAKGGRELPHKELLFDLRRRLLGSGFALPKRKNSAKRFFFSPFEDFFVADHEGKKRRGKIARSSLGPLWRLMMTDHAFRGVAFAAAALNDAYEAGDETAALEQAMFDAAQDELMLLRDSAQDDATRETLIERLHGKASFADAMEITRLLPGVDVFKALREMIPDNAKALSEEQYHALKNLFLVSYEAEPAIAAYLLLALKGRMEKPWAALGVYYSFIHSSDERLKSTRQAIMFLGESIFEDLEDLARYLERDSVEDYDPKTTQARIGYFIDYVEGLLGQAAKANDNVFINRIEASRELVAESLGGYAEQALSLLRGAMPIRQTGGDGGLISLRPDISMPFGRGQVSDACAAATFLSAIGILAARLNIDSAALEPLREEAAERVFAYADDLVAEIRSAEGEERKAARRMLEYVLEFAEPLLADDDVGLIRDRAAAAAVTV